MNMALRLALIEKFGSQVVAARKLGIRENKLSYLVRGHTQPSDTERRSLEKVLGRERVNGIFDTGRASEEQTTAM
jgi:ribosome-binding protein aMBF1 (putative translation factor)